MDEHVTNNFVDGKAASDKSDDLAQVKVIVEAVKGLAMSDLQILHPHTIGRRLTNPTACLSDQNAKASSSQIQEKKRIIEENSVKKKRPRKESLKLRLNRQAEESTAITSTPRKSLSVNFKLPSSAVVKQGRRPSADSIPQVPVKLSEHMKKKFQELFRFSHGPESALATHVYDLQTHHGTKWQTVAQDRHACPSKGVVQNLYKQIPGQPSLLQLLSIFLPSMDPDSCIEHLDDCSWYCILVTPLMKRNRSLNSLSSDINYIATYAGHTDTLYFVVSNSAAGELPLAAVITSAKKDALLTAAFQSYSRMVEKEPVAFVTEDSSMLRNALKVAFPSSRRIIGLFHILQSAWKFVMNEENRIPDSYQVSLYQLVLKMITATNKVAVGKQKRKADTMASELPQVTEYIEQLYEQRRDWCLDFIEPAIRENYALDSSLQFMKNIVLNKFKGFSIGQLAHFIASRLDRYYAQRICDILDNGYAITFASQLDVFMACSIPEGNISRLGLLSDIYLVKGKREDTKFYVNDTVGRCSCTREKSGFLCPHQHAVSLFYGSNETRDVYAPMARGVRDMMKDIRGERASVDSVTTCDGGVIKFKPIDVGLDLEVVDIDSLDNDANAVGAESSSRLSHLTASQVERTEEGEDVNINRAHRSISNITETLMECLNEDPSLFSGMITKFDTLLTGQGSMSALAASLGSGNFTLPTRKDVEKSPLCESKSTYVQHAIVLPKLQPLRPKKPLPDKPVFKPSSSKEPPPPKVQPFVPTKKQLRLVRDCSVVLDPTAVKRFLQSTRKKQPRGRPRKKPPILSRKISKVLFVKKHGFALKKMKNKSEPEVVVIDMTVEDEESSLVVEEVPSVIDETNVVMKSGCEVPPILSVPSCSFVLNSTAVQESLKTNTKKQPRSRPKKKLPILSVPSCSVVLNSTAVQESLKTNTKKQPRSRPKKKLPILSLNKSEPEVVVIDMTVEDEESSLVVEEVPSVIDETNVVMKSGCEVPPILSVPSCSFVLNSTAVQESLKTNTKKQPRCRPKKKLPILSVPSCSVVLNSTAVQESLKTNTKKQPRGRPKKKLPILSLPSCSVVLNSTAVQEFLKTNTKKRSRGRPKKKVPILSGRISKAKIEKKRGYDSAVMKSGNADAEEDARALVVDDPSVIVGITDVMESDDSAVMKSGNADPEEDARALVVDDPSVIVGITDVMESDDSAVMKSGNADAEEDARALVVDDPSVIVGITDVMESDDSAVMKSGNADPEEDARALVVDDPSVIVGITDVMESDDSAVMKSGNAGAEEDARASDDSAVMKSGNAGAEEDARLVPTGSEAGNVNTSTMAEDPIVKYGFAVMMDKASEIAYDERSLTIDDSCLIDLTDDVTDGNSPSEMTPKCQVAGEHSYSLVPTAGEVKDPMTVVSVNDKYLDFHVLKILGKPEVIEDHSQLVELLFCGEGSSSVVVENPEAALIKEYPPEETKEYALAQIGDPTNSCYVFYDDYEYSGDEEVIN